MGGQDTALLCTETHATAPPGSSHLQSRHLLAEIMRYLVQKTIAAKKATASSPSAVARCKFGHGPLLLDISSCHATRWWWASFPPLPSMRRGRVASVGILASRSVKRHSWRSLLGYTSAFSSLLWCWAEALMFWTAEVFCVASDPTDDRQHRVVCWISPWDTGGKRDRFPKACTKLYRPCRKTDGCRLCLTSPALSSVGQSTPLNGHIPMIKRLSEDPSDRLLYPFLLGDVRLVNTWFFFGVKLFCFFLGQGALESGGRPWSKAPGIDSAESLVCFCCDTAPTPATVYLRPSLKRIVPRGTHQELCVCVCVCT